MHRAKRRRAVIGGLSATARSDSAITRIALAHSTHSERVSEILTPPSTQLMTSTVNFAKKSINRRSPVTIRRHAIATKPSTARYAARYLRVGIALQEKIVLLAGIRVTRGEILSVTASLDAVGGRLPEERDKYDRSPD